MHKTVLGIFENRTDAERAVNELQDTGFNAKDISLIMKDGVHAEEVRENTGTDVAGGVVSGATTGGVIGGLAGLLIGVGALAIPGIGAVLIGGPIAAALGLTGAAASTVSGAVTGALAGGLIGGLVDLGLPREDAEVYERRVKEGAILVAVPARDSDSEVRDILENNGAEQIRSVEDASSRTRTTHTPHHQAYPSEVTRTERNYDEDLED